MRAKKRFGKSSDNGLQGDSLGWGCFAFKTFPSNPFWRRRLQIGYLSGMYPAISSLILPTSIHQFSINLFPSLPSSFLSLSSAFSFSSFSSYSFYFLSSFSFLFSFSSPITHSSLYPLSQSTLLLLILFLFIVHLLSVVCSLLRRWSVPYFSLLSHCFIWFY